MGGKSNKKIVLKAETSLPTRFGTFKLAVFESKQDQKQHIVLIKGNLKAARQVSVRIHSECLTGDTLFSMRCDCGEQLQKSFEIIGKARQGMIIYLRQEGRGIGLLNKLKAYALQDQGFDTVEANQKLGLKPDARSYDIAGEILQHYKIKKIKLLTNNPEKIMELESFVKIVERIPLEIKPNRINKKYLRTKKEYFGHFLNHA